MGPSDSRGQAYTIEGIIGAIVIASALVLGLQAVDIAPWTEDSTDRQTEALRVQVQDVLEAAEDRDAIRTAATCLDGDRNPSPHPAVAAGGAENDTVRDQLGILLNRTLDRNNYRYTVYVDHGNTSDPGDLNTTAITVPNDATRSSVTVTRQVVLFDSDPIYEFDSDLGQCVRVTSGENNTLRSRQDDPGRDVYIKDQNEDSQLFAVVRIRVVAW
ncbi:hypothetical protein BRD08_10515 [Halobacteriales archaeon SW_10_66_29]|nr:MAG: hypothetical protein BRD08_10515 [Halobacteriales archaeon SW_10_66_29]